MTPTQTDAEPLPLDPATFNTMLATTVEALPHPPRTTPESRAQQREAAFLAIAALRPRDPLEAMLAARIVALHFQAMYNLACAIQPNVPGDLQLRCQARAQALGRQSDKMRTDYLTHQETEVPRRPAGLPASAAVTPQPQPAPEPAPEPQPVPQAAKITPTPPPPQAAPNPTTPTAQPKAPAPTPRNGHTLPLDKATLEKLVAEAKARVQTSAAALAA